MNVVGGFSHPRVTVMTKFLFRSIAAHLECIERWIAACLKLGWASLTIISKVRVTFSLSTLIGLSAHVTVKVAYDWLKSQSRGKNFHMNAWLGITFDVDFDYLWSVVNVLLTHSVFKHMSSSISSDSFFSGSASSSRRSSSSSRPPMKTITASSTSNASAVREPLSSSSLRNRENIIVSNREIRQLFDSIKELGDTVKRQNEKIERMAARLDGTSKDVVELKTVLNESISSNKEKENGHSGPIPNELKVSKTFFIRSLRKFLSKDFKCTFLASHVNSLHRHHPWDTSSRGWSEIQHNLDQKHHFFKQTPDGGNITGPQSVVTYMYPERYFPSS